MSAAVNIIRFPLETLPDDPIGEARFWVRKLRRELPVLVGQARTVAQIKLDWWEREIARLEPIRQIDNDAHVALLRLAIPRS